MKVLLEASDCECIKDELSQRFDCIQGLLSGVGGIIAEKDLLRRGLRRTCDCMFHRNDCSYIAVEVKGAGGVYDALIQLRECVEYALQKGATVHTAILCIHAEECKRIADPAKRERVLLSKIKESLIAFTHNMTIVDVRRRGLKAEIRIQHDCQVELRVYGRNGGHLDMRPLRIHGNIPVRLVFCNQCVSLRAACNIP